MILQFLYGRWQGSGGTKQATVNMKSTIMYNSLISL